MVVTTVQLMVLTPSMVPPHSTKPVIVVGSSSILPTGVTMTYMGTVTLLAGC